MLKYDGASVSMWVNHRHKMRMSQREARLVTQTRQALSLESRAFGSQSISSSAVRRSHHYTIPPA
jgi:hypothetical protein